MLEIIRVRYSVAMQVNVFEEEISSLREKASSTQQQSRILHFEFQTREDELESELRKATIKKRRSIEKLHQSKY